MTKRKLLWLIPTVFYGLFVVWYTDFGGPLSDEEVDTFVATLQARNADPQTLAKLEGFLRSDTGRQFLMLNALDMNDNPPDVEGAAPGESADQLMGRYMEDLFPSFLLRACHPVIMVYAVYTAIDVLGIEGAEQWTGGAFMRYRSRRSFMEVVSNPDIVDKHEFKFAALDKTIAYPVETTIYLGDLRLLLGLILLSIAALLDIALFRR